MDCGKYTAEQIASWFLLYNNLKVEEEGADSITNLKLQKLLYYAQGCYLALENKPLFNDNIVAWKHGPVVECIYNKYSPYGSSGISIEESDYKNVEDIEKRDCDILEEVYKVFGKYSAWQLRNMTHEESPWKETMQSDIISNDKIKSYFIENYITD